MKISIPTAIFNLRDWTALRGIVYRVVFLILCCLSVTNGLLAQKDALKQATEAYDDGRYREALIYYNQIGKIESSGPLLFKRGVCQYHINQLDIALQDFRRAVEFGFDDPEIDYYTGLIEHEKGRFASAAAYYKKYLNTLDQDDILRRSLHKRIKQCGKAIDLSYQSPIAIVEQLPSGVNTTYDEVGLLESPTIPGRYYYSSNKPNTSLTMSASDYDVYYTEKTGTNYSDAHRMKYFLNKSKEEVLLGFSPAGDDLYFYRGEPHDGQIALSRGLNGKSATVFVDLDSEFTLFSGDAYFYDDDVVIFSKKDPNGYGGYDLYVSIRENDKWSDPQNLGPEVNSSFDEVSPYLNLDGSELYFSSNRSESIGGMDIFLSRYLYEAKRWATPKNMGIPINSPGDDTYFSLSSDGLAAYLSSDRKSAIGGKDVFIARFKNQRAILGEPEVLAFINYRVPERDFKTEDIAVEEEVTPTVKQNINFTYQPIYFASGMDLINPDTEPEILRLIQLMREVPSLELTLNCHSSEEGILEYKLYSSLKIAERLEKYMIERGIADSRIHLIGSADNYPIAITESKGGDYKLADQYNARIELEFSNYDPEQVTLTKVEADIPRYTQDKKYPLWQALVEEDLTYKIQIAVVNQMYRGMALDLFNDAIVEEDEATGLYNYTIGLYDSYADALAVKRDMDHLGITSAKVIPYYDGRRLSEDQYSYFVNEYPDLRALMNFDE